MIRILVISLFIIFNYQVINGQEIKKEKIYLLLKKNKGFLPRYSMKKFYTKKGLNINLIKYYFLHKKNMQKDTLCISHLKDYKITKEIELNSIKKEWYKKNKKYFLEYHKKNKVPHPPISKNGVFDINIIEKINKTQIVIYQVIFRNEGAIQ